MPYNPNTSRQGGPGPEPDPKPGTGITGAAPSETRGPADDGGADAGTFHLRILATSDLHAHLLSYDYFTNRPLFGRGLEQTAILIAQARQEVPQALLLDNGDFLQGTALGELAAQGGERGRHPVITAFNTLRYDAVALGNHEFDYGTGFLEAALKSAHFPALSANILLQRSAHPCRDVTFAAPYVLLRRALVSGSRKRAEITVGILGLTPPSVIRWNRRHLQGRLTARPMVEAARAWVPAMREAGAEVVVCLAHAGAGTGTHMSEEDIAAAAIARIPGVDVVIAGHSHRVHPPPRLPIPLHRKGEVAPVVQPGFAGSHLALVDLWLEKGRTGWEIRRTRAAAQSVSEHVAGLSTVQIGAHARPLRRTLGADHRSALEMMRRPVGASAVALHSWFATAANSAALRLAGAAFAEWARGRLHGHPEAGLPVIAVVRPLRSGGWGGPLNYTDIPAGSLSLRHVFDLYPFPNTIMAEVATVAALRARLDRASRIFRRIRPGGTDQMLIDPGLPASTFEVAPALSYRIDLNAPQESGRRIRELALDGRVMAPDESVVIVTNSFLDASAPTIGGRRILDEGMRCTEVIVSFLEKAGVWAPQPAPGWSFVPTRDTSVLYDSGASAADHLDAVAHLAPEFVGVSAGGFHRFRLHLDQTGHQG